MKPKILLVYPKTSLDKPGVSVGLPMSVLYAAAILDKDGYEVALFDSRIEHDLSFRLKVINYDIVGISAMTGYQIKDGLKYAKATRHYNPKAKIVWGGVHASLMPEQTLNHSLVDAIIVGEGEMNLRCLVHDYETGNMERIYGNPGFLKLDTLPDPPYHLLDPKKYFLNLYQSKKTMSILSARGCPFSCKYCYNQSFNRNCWRPLSPEIIIRRIKQALDFGAESVDLVDDNFFVKKDRVIKFCDLLKKENININILTNCRIDFLHNVPDSFLKMIYDCGFKELFIGVESGCQETLNNIGKGITLEQIRSVNKRLGAIGIKPIYSFITGFPDETYSQTLETIDLMLELQRDNPGACVTALKLYTPFPGTELYARCLELGMTFPDNLEGWSEFDYNSATFTKDKRLVKLSYITYFLDHKNMLNFTTSKIVRTFIILYSWYVKLRAKIHFFAFMPEWRIIKWLKEK